MKQTFSVVSTLVLMLIVSAPARAALELNEGDSIVVVGNTFAERLALSGYFDAMVHAANPDKKIVIRSVPNSADEVDDMPREHSVPPADFYLKRHGADVVVMCFGMSESFDGLAGVGKFEADLAKQVDKHLNAKYNGESSPKIVLVSPIAHEDLGGNWVTGDAVVERNQVLKAYTAAMKKVAEDKGAVFVDLFNLSPRVVDAKEPPLTNNGIAPTEFGCYVYAGEMARQLGWWDGGTDNGAQDKAEKLREVAYDKHYQFRLRYRATNTEYVWGRRHKPFGVVNFPPELDQWDRMTEGREKAMWAMDKPSVGQLFAKPPTGKAIWEEQPRNFTYPEDQWTPVKIEIPKITRAVGDPDQIKAPEEYLKTFQVAEGYQVNLFASEREFPELANPLAMTFDYKGRLWVLCSPTYPHPMPADANDWPSDCKLIILDDTDGDGKADKCTTFARYMTIPTCFVIDANGAAYIGQAPDLWKMTDTDGDDVADKKEIVYSGFGMPDSHHTISAAVWDPNGGILMLEGVFTRTNVETPYGTQRTRDAAIWRLDPRTGKLIAIGHTGHPNPWGQTFDEYGQSILMDTSGTAQYNFSSLISPYIFPDKPPKGPPVVKRGRPTAGCEIIYSRHFPDDVQGTYVHSQCIGFLGTNWDRLKSDGATNSGYSSEPMPEPILSSKEGNYRPVCSELGPDGALYIADWVNPLIGHMQFNLRDPRRDRSHGRIYRVTHKTRPLVDTPDLTKLSMDELFEQFKVPEQNTRDRARRLLQNMDADKVSKAATDWLMKQNPRDEDYDRWALEALWVQQGAGKIDMKVVDEVMRAREPMVRAGGVRALRIALQFGDMAPADAKSFIAQSVTDRDMRVRLEAVMACAYLDTPDAADLANRVTTQPMDTAIRNAHKQTIKVLKENGIEPIAGLFEKYTMDQVALLEELKKK
ncbi:MAG: PVC-type heme-binding CxxCH protein [Phycisphaeraceae bacterium]